MKKGVVLLTGLMLIDLPVFAESGIFKCTGADGAIAYQATSCKAQQQQVTLIEPRKREAEPTAAEASSGKPVGDPGDSGSKRSPVVADELVAGMSDTKVLNMRGWGRPRNIARSRGEDGWREEWTYGSADGAVRLVQFVNGKVAAVRSQDAPQVARAPSMRLESQQIIAASATASAQSAEDRSREALSIADGLTRDSTGSNGRRERTWQPGIAEKAPATPKTYAASEGTPKSQPQPRPVGDVASAPSVHDAYRRADPRPVGPEPSVQPEIPSASENWRMVRTEPSSVSQALGAQPPQAIVQGNADRELVRGEDTASQ